MPLRYQLTLKVPGAADTVLAGEFSDAEAAVLEAYLEQHDQLITSQPLREGVPCNIHVQYDEDIGLRVEATLPTDDQLSILLHRLRPFILQEEPASFGKTTAILGKHLDSAPLRQLLKSQREMYDGRQAQRTMRVVSDDMVVNSETTLQHWLNSHEYHRDRDRKAVIQSLYERMPGDLLRGLLVSMIIDKTYAVRNIAALVALLLGRTKELKFDARRSLPASV